MPDVDAALDAAIEALAEYGVSANRLQMLAAIHAYHAKLDEEDEQR